MWWYLVGVDQIFLKMVDTHISETFLSAILFFFLATFLYSTISITVTTTSLISGTCLLGMFIIRVSNRMRSKESAGVIPLHNPLKGKPKDNSLNDIDIEIKNKVYNFLTFDASNVASLENFSVIQNNSACIFAKKAKIWGSRDWISELSLEENTFRNIPTLIVFTMVCYKLGLDGFLIELPGPTYSDSLQKFSCSVKRVLKVISDNDPVQRYILNKSYIDKTGWVFEFNKQTFFITTFAPFYPKNNSRFNYGVENGYILLQPEISFAQHDLPPDTTETNWDEPKTIRDKIRKSFRDVGQEYDIPDTLIYPMSHDVVKPIERTDSVVEWWKT